VRAALAICLLAVALSGCGSAAQDSSKDFNGEERKVAAVIEQLETAARKDDVDRVCKKLLAPSLLDAVKKKGTNCPTAVKDSFKDADSFDVKVDDVKISGDSATAKVTSGASGSKQKTDTFLLERDGTTWKITGLAG
jgi:hypothetical protein